MDIKIWLYIIIGVIYILSRILKKKEPEPQIPQNRPEARPLPEVKNSQSRPSKPLTFEELLKEISEAKKPPVSAQPTHSQPEYVDYDDEIEAEEKSLEQVDYSTKRKDKLYDVYEDAKRQAFNRPSLEETMNVRDTVVQFEKFKVFEQDQQKNILHEYTKDFQDPEGLKKAVVMAEILNRKF